MKFISKNQNLGVILKSGIPANRMIGQEYVPSLSVKFQQGVLVVPDEDTDIIKLLRGHDGFSTDFICADDQEEPEKDPYSHQRAENEPEHNLTDIQPGGIIGKSTGTPRKVKLTPVMAELIEKMAMQMAIKIAPKMAAELVEKLSVKAEAETPKVVQPADEENAALAEDLLPEEELVPAAPLVSPVEENSPFVEDQLPPNEPSRAPLDESKLPQPMEAPKPPKAKAQKKTTTRKSSAKKINKVQEPEVILDDSVAEEISE